MKTRNITLALLALIAAAALLLPWKSWLHSQIQAALARQGITAEFTLEHAGITQLTLADISVTGTPVLLERMSINYSLPRLLQQKLDNVRLEELVFTKDDIKIRAKDMVISLDPASRKGDWHGSWKAASIALEGLPVPLPEIAGEGEFAATLDGAEVKGTFKNKEATHNAALTINYKAADKTLALFIPSAALPWNGGLVTTRDARFALLPVFSGKLTLNVQNLPLDVLMQLATANRANATGIVSGSVPVSIANGEVKFQSGSLKAQESGIIKLAPDAIPGDNEQVALVRDILKNFHYTNFAMGINSGKDDKLSMLLQLSGNNPEVYNGREVKLNVNLTGDLLSVIRQSMMSVSDPQQLMKDSHAKP